jgi:hypothetical protein
MDTHSKNVRASLGHVLAAAFVSGAVTLLAFESFLYMMEWTKGRNPRFSLDLSLVFAPILGLFALAIVTPIHMIATRFLARYFGGVARLAYLLPLISIALALIELGRGLDSSPAPFDLEAMLMTVATGVPAALVFHFTVYRRAQPVGSWMLAAAAVIWLVAVLVGQFGVPDTQRVDSSPLATRDHVIENWRQYGQTLVLVLGFASFVIWHIRANRVAFAVLLAGLAVPLCFIGWYFAVPLGDGFARVDLGNRIVLIDWKREPYTYNGRTNFNIADDELYQNAGRNQMNRTLSIQPAKGPLHSVQIYGKLPAPAQNQWGLACSDTEFRGRILTFCGQPGMPENWTTEILIEKGYIFIQFDHNGVRYGLHGDAADTPNWRLIEQSAIRLLDFADMSEQFGRSLSFPDGS